jgi:hypothetical protein
MADEWWYAKNGQQMGPVSTAVLTQMAASGQVAPTDLIWREGMPNWAPARTVRGIYPESLTPAPAAPVPAAPAGPEVYGLSPDPAPAPYANPLRERQPEVVAPDEDYWDRPRPRRKPPSNANIAVLVIGISVAVLLVIVLVILIATGVLFGTRNPRTFDIAPGEKKTFHITFPAGQKAEIWITSKNNTDIDIFVFDEAGRKVAQDVAFDKDCYVWFQPTHKQSFRVEVVNINMGGRLPVGPNTCTMKWSPP